MLFYLYNFTVLLIQKCMLGYIIITTFNVEHVQQLHTDQPIRTYKGTWTFLCWVITFAISWENRSQVNLRFSTNTINHHPSVSVIPIPLLSSSPTHILSSLSFSSFVSDICLTHSILPCPLLFLKRVGFPLPLFFSLSLSLFCSFFRFEETAGSSRNTRDCCWDSCLGGNVAG